MNPYISAPKNLLYFSLFPPAVSLFVPLFYVSVLYVSSLKCFSWSVKHYYKNEKMYYCHLMNSC